VVTWLKNLGELTVYTISEETGNPYNLLWLFGIFVDQQTTYSHAVDCVAYLYCAFTYSDAMNHLFVTYNGCKGSRIIYIYKQVLLLTEWSFLPMNKLAQRNNHTYADYGFLI